MFHLILVGIPSSLILSVKSRGGVGKGGLHNGRKLDKSCMLIAPLTGGK